MTESFYMIMALLRKEMLTIFKDPSSRALLIVPPIIQAFLFGYVATFDLKEVNYAFNDRCHCEASRELRAEINGSGFFVEKPVSGGNSMDSYIDAMNREEILVIVSVDENFEKKVKNRGDAKVQVLLDGRNSTTAGTAGGYLSQIVSRFSEKKGFMNAPFSLEYRPLYNLNSITRWNILPALIATLSLIQVIMLSALSVARERERGTFEQLLVTPLTQMQILAGKAIPPIIVGLGQSSFILLVALFWFKVPFSGNILSLYFGLLLFTCACVGYGLSISAFAANMQQAMLYAFVLLVPLALLSGLMTPIANMPDVWQYMTWLNPLRYAIDFARRVYLEGAAIPELWYDLLPLALISMITLSFAGWMFRHHVV